MPNKSELNRRGDDRRKQRHRVGLYDDSSENANPRRNPLDEKVREAWRQILDRRRGERRVSDQYQHMPADVQSVNGLGA